MNKLLLILIIILLLSSTALAQTQNCGPVGSGYRLCVPLPGQPLQVANLGDYIRIIYQFSLAIAGVIVFVRIVYGGIMYSLSAGNTSKLEDAKTTITQAIWGLLLLLAAVLILYIINPNLLKIRFGETFISPNQKLIKVNNPTAANQKVPAPIPYQPPTIPYYPVDKSAPVERIPFPPYSP